MSPRSARTEHEPVGSPVRPSPLARLRALDHAATATVAALALLVAAAFVATAGYVVGVGNDLRLVRSERAGLPAFVALAAADVTPPGEDARAATLAALAGARSVSGYRPAVVPPVSDRSGDRALALALAASREEVGRASSLMLDPENVTHDLVEAVGDHIGDVVDAESDTRAEAIARVRRALVRAGHPELASSHALVGGPDEHLPDLAVAAGAVIDARLAARQHDLQLRFLLVLGALALLLAAGAVASLAALRAGRAALRRADEDAARLRHQVALAEALPVAIWSADADGRIVSISPRWEALTGQPVADALGEGWLDVVHPDEREALRERWCGAATARVAELRDGFRIVRPDGSEALLRVSCRLLPGEPPAFVGATEDRTAAAAAEAALHDALAAQSAALGVSRDLAASATLPEAWDRCAGMLAAHAGADRALLLRDDGDGLVVEAVAGLGCAFSPGDRVARGALPPFLSPFDVPAPGGRWGVVAVAVDGSPGHVAAVEATVALVAGTVARLAAERAREHAARHDPATGLPNRTAFVAEVADALQRGDGAAVVVADVVEVAVVNAAQGRAAGDAALAATASALAAGQRPGDVLARVGGDSFALLMPGDSGDRALSLAARLAGDSITPGALVLGVATADATGGTADALVEGAFAARTAARRAGRTTGVYDEALRDTLAERGDLDRGLRRALAHGEFELVCQPIIDLKRGTIAHAEALLRWHDPQHGVVRPDRFIPYAEQTGLIVPMGAWALHEACRLAVRLDAELGGKGIPLTVNVSAVQFRDDDVPALVRAALADARCPARLLGIELTETAFVDDAERLAHAVREIRAAGVRILLDDFGTGYSSLASLRSTGAHVLKLDRSLIEGFGVDEDCTSIVAATLAIARALDLDVVAEGIERPETAALLDANGCTYGQGYLFSRPVAFAELVSMLLEEAAAA